MQALLKDAKQKLVRGNVNITKKEEMEMPQAFPPNMKDSESLPSLVPLVE